MKFRLKSSRAQRIQVIVYRFNPRVRQRQYLLLQRRSAYGGYWEPINADVNTSGAASTARQQVYDQAGIFSRESAVSLGYTFQGRDRDQNAYDESAYGLKADDADGVTLSSRHGSYRWASYDEAVDLLYWEYHKEALRRAHHRS